MSPRDPNTKDTDNIKFFKVDTDGNIEPLYGGAASDADLPPLSPELPLMESSPNSEDGEKGPSESLEPKGLVDESLENPDVLSQLEDLKKFKYSSKKEMEALRLLHQEDLLRLKNDYDEKLRLSGNYEARVEQFYAMQEDWKERVRQDLKTLKIKEKTLDSKYELLRKDSQTILDSKDKLLFDLKHKLDLLQIEYESLEEKLRNLTHTLDSVDAKKNRLIETMRLALSLLEGITNEPVTQNDPIKKQG